MGMDMDMLHSVSVFMAACSRRVARASRRLCSSCRILKSLNCAKISPGWAPYLSRRISMTSLRGCTKEKEDAPGEHKQRRGRESMGSEEEDEESSEEEDEESSEEEEAESSEEEEEENGVWRRTILMGEKCQPLDFSGVIYYDSEGRQLSGPPRSPLRNPPPSFSTPAAVSCEKKGVGNN